MGWDGRWLDGLQAQRGAEGSRGALAECVSVSEHKLSQSQNNNNPGMHGAARDPREKTNIRQAGEVSEEACLERGWERTSELG